ncbi:type II toxin-antitoxin system death-on-curing family toxin [Blastopirellula marina]|uniref:Type II toxin-antitoxin system death-on-curing family toxin n=1 Tax=Blastopirellula marina TaxID=124 RepID=A0A2S8FUJ0_9BACT|nr:MULTISPECIES: type II toxin-antitoxin system death-on-curing family toxin [Pirellulaceae]PQO35842.1 type II toxin-antitoxin system death-on-curing family toxin [Blastopirellula marina]RCS53417.1 type II toxin-antitoxin system death-on-curing family toxin [Bremerella cremea]
MLFLSIEDALAIHRWQIETYGGQDGLRDRGLLESALAMPLATYGGTELHPTIFDKASAYVFHLAPNHPFLDGNKRISAAAGIIFLKVNGYELHTTQDSYTELILNAAQGKIQKPEISEFFRTNTKPIT